jgi:hypothetical protein
MEYPAIPKPPHSTQLPPGPSLMCSFPAAAPLDEQVMPRLLRGTRRRATASWIAELTEGAVGKRGGPASCVGGVAGM